MRLRAKRIEIKSAEALCLQACRGFEPAPNPPNLQNLKQAHKGEGLPSPYPLPDGPARSVATFFNGVAAPSESKIRGKKCVFAAYGPHQARTYAYHTPKVTPNAPIFHEKVNFL